MNILNACVSFFLGRYRKRHWPTNKQPAIKVQTVTFILNELILQPVQCKFCERFPNAKTDEWQTALYIRVVRHHADTVSGFRCPNLKSLWHLNFQQQFVIINAWYLHVHQHLHGFLRLSVLNRILPWGVPGSPLLRNRGPVRKLGGQGEPALQMICPLREVPTWSNMATGCTNLCIVCGTNESQWNKTKDFESFDITILSCGNPARPQPGENTEGLTFDIH